MAEEADVLVAEEKGLERDGDLSEEIEEGEIKDDDANPDAAAARVGAEQPHPLEHSWTFWYDNPQSKSKNVVWGSSLRRIHTFSTVEDFWGLYNNINHPSKLIVGADFHCFKDNVEPKWEDPVCANGGKWTISCLRGRSDQMWLYTLLAMIGEQFDYGDEICGAVVSVRAKQEKIALWTKNAANEKAQMSIGKQWKELLDYNDNIYFLVHDDVMKLDKLAKNRYTLSRRFYVSSSNPSRCVRPFRCGAAPTTVGTEKPASGTQPRLATNRSPPAIPLPCPRRTKTTLLTIRGHLLRFLSRVPASQDEPRPKRASAGSRDSSSTAADPETKSIRPRHPILGTLVLIPWRCLEKAGILQEAEWIHRALIPCLLLQSVKRWSFGLVIFSNSNQEKMVKKKLVCEEGDNECSNKKKLSSCSSTPHFPCHPRPVHPSFLKIMIGDFQDFLFIPPDFTKVMVDLVDKHVYLKTSLGSCFKVKLSAVDKSLAFKDGWPDFVLDHSVAAGEILVFTYVCKFLFTVEIFGIDTCERVYFGKTDGNILNGKKKEKADTSFRRPQLVKGQKSFEASSFKKDSLEKTDPPSTNKNVSKCLGGTEVHFGKMSDNLCSRKNRRKADSSLERPQIVKKPHFLKVSNAKKRLEEINDPTISANCIAESLMQNNNESGNSPQGLEMMDGSDYGCVAKNPDKVEKKPKFPPPHSCGSGSPRDVDVIQINRPSANMIRGEVPIEDEESGHSFVHEINNKQLSSCRDLILVSPEVDVLFPSDITEMYHLGENEYDYLHEHNVMNAIAADEIVVRFLLTEDGVCHIVEDNIENGQCKTNIIVEYNAGEKGNGIGGINTVAAEEVVCKFLITEDGICHIVSEDITHGQGTATNTNVTGNSMGCIDTVNMPRDASSNHESSPAVNPLAPVIQHINDQRANRILVHKKRSRTGCSYIKRLTSSLDSFGGNHQDMSYMTTEANQSDNNLQDIPDRTAAANQTGKVSDILLEVNGEDNDSCLGRSHDPKSAAVKPTDLDGVFSLSSPCFSFTLSSNYQFYIELPRSMQLPKGRKRTETKIVILRDSCLRLWPVMYRETDQFTGFVAGWNDFVKANDLRQGYHCNVFSIGNKYEPLYHVQITQQ